MYSTDVFKILYSFLFFVAAVCGNPLSRLRRSTSKLDDPFSTCPNKSLISDPQLYYPNTGLVPVHAFEMPTGPDYDTSGSIPDSECPYDREPTDASLSESGLCPYDFYEDYQADRIPAKIMKARCRPSCTTCIDPFTNAQTSALRCKPVVYTIKAMKKVGCDGDVVVYEQYDEVIPVACMCQRRVSQTQPGPDPGNLPPN